MLRFLKGGCESIYIKFVYNCVNFNSARLGVKFSDKVCLAVFLSIVISFLAGVVCFSSCFQSYIVIRAEHRCFLCVRRIVICLKTVMLVSLLLCWVVDWYCQAHPRSVSQSDEYLRVEKGVRRRPI